MFNYFAHDNIKNVIEIYCEYHLYKTFFRSNELGSPLKPELISGVAFHLFLVTITIIVNEGIELILFFRVIKSHTVNWYVITL